MTDEPEQEYMTVEFRIMLPADVKALGRLNRELEAAIKRTGLTSSPITVRGPDEDARSFASDRQRFAESVLAGRGMKPLLAGTPGMERSDGATVDLAEYDLNLRYRAMIDARIAAGREAAMPDPPNCEACWHLWTMHGPGGCNAPQYPAFSVHGQLCGCEHLPPDDHSAATEETP